MIELIENEYGKYPVFQSTGFAAQFAFPFAQKICTGVGYDIGCNRKEWALPGSIPIDPELPGCDYDAYNLPDMSVNFIFSSHMLEHAPNWVKCLDYWQTRLAPKGTLYLYLPHPSQRYWKPWNNKKHIHSLHPEMIEEYLIDRGWDKVIVTKCPDLNHSFHAIAEKK